MHSEKKPRESRAYCLQISRPCALKHLKSFQSSCFVRTETQKEIAIIFTTVDATPKRSLNRPNGGRVFVVRLIVFAQSRSTRAHITIGDGGLVEWGDAVGACNALLIPRLSAIDARLQSPPDTARDDWDA
jgi:hypothetical protein